MISLHLISSTYVITKTTLEQSQEASDFFIKVFVRGVWQSGGNGEGAFVSKLHW